MSKLDILLLVSQALAWVGIFACAAAILPWARRAWHHWSRSRGRPLDRNGGRAAAA